MRSIKPMFLCLLALIFFCQTSRADTAALQTFKAGSYQKILKAHQHTPFIVIIWSINCPSCLEEMQLLSEIHARNPNLNMIMLSTDTKIASEQIQMYLDQYQLTDVENWLFDEQDSKTLRRTIDQTWQGEVPRSYFYQSSGAKKGVSGLLARDEFQKLLQEIIH